MNDQYLKVEKFLGCATEISRLEIFCKGVQKYALKNIRSTFGNFPLELRV